MGQPMTDRLSLVAAVLLTACATSTSSYQGSHITASAPVAAPHTRTVERGATATRAPAVPAPSTLWPELGDSTLDALIDEARRANGDVLVAEQRLNASRASRRLALLDYAPRVTATGSSLRSQQSMAGIPGLTGPLPAQQLWDVGFDASWEVDIFQRVGRTARAQGEFVAAAERSADDVQLSVIAELARSYFELRGAQWRLAVAERSLTNQRATLRLTQLRRDAGVGEEQDVASAAARVAAIEATVPSLNFDVARAEYRVAVLTGTRPGELNADLAPRTYPAIAKALPIGDPGELLQRRPDVRAAERRLAAATERQGVAAANLFPQVSVSGFIGFVAGRGSTFFTGDSRAFSVSPGLSWSAFDLGRARARVRGSSAATEESLAFYEDTVLRALEETEDALANYHAQQARLIKLNDQARESKRAADIARLRYREGVVDFLSLLDAERTQLQAEDAVAESEKDVYVAVIALYKALGGVPS